MVKALSHISRHFDVLDLVTADRYLCSAEHQNIGTHQHWVHEKTCRDISIRVVPRGFVFIHRGLVGMGAVKNSFARHAGEQPGQLGDFRYVRLAIKRDPFRVKTGG